MLMEEKDQKNPRSLTPQMALWQQRWEQMRKEMLSQASFSEQQDLDQPASATRQKQFALA